MLVAFEYFSACEQAKSIMDLLELGQSIDLGDYNFTRDLVFDSDCAAIFRLRETERLFYGYEQPSIILEICSYERIREEYFGIGFPERAENILQNCRI